MINRDKASGVFITATDTEVGKTQVAAAILIKLAEMGIAAVGMKPVASGAHMSPHGLRSEDAEILIAASGVSAAYKNVNPYVFEPAIAPHLAASRASIQINLRHIVSKYDLLLQQAEFVVVEGAGGWKVPLNDTETLADLASALDLPVILVVAIRLGCINHAIISAESIAQSGVRLLGWIANFTSPKSATDDQTVDSLEHRLSVPLIATVPHVENCCPEKVVPFLDFRLAKILWPKRQFNTV